MTAAGIIQNVSGTTTLTNVTLSAGSSFNILGGTVVNLAGTTFTNNGTVYCQRQQHRLRNHPHRGAGSQHHLCRKRNASAERFGRACKHSPPAGATLTNPTTHTIQGAGEINAALTNHGIVNATSTHNGSLLTLLSSDETNTGTLEATTGHWR